MRIKSRGNGGFTLVELMVTFAITVIVATVVAAFVYYSSRSFVAMSHYTEMNQKSQLALDKMSKEVREANRVTELTSTTIKLQNPDGSTYAFTYDPSARTLSRVAGGKSTTYLKECDSMQFKIYQHIMKSNSFDCYETSNLGNARVIQVTWSCSRPVLGSKGTTDSIQASKIKLRNR